MTSISGDAYSNPVGLIPSSPVVIPAEPGLNAAVQAWLVDLVDVQTSLGSVGYQYEMPS